MAIMAERTGLVLGLLLTLCTCNSVTSEDVISIKEGETAEFKCNFGTVNAPRVEWKFTSGPDTVLIYYDQELTAPYKSRVKVYNQGIQMDKVTRKDTGEYVCEVTSKDSAYQEIKSRLIVLVPPSVPIAQVPTSVSTGSAAILTCLESDASPPPTFAWYKNNVLMPANPKTSPAFQNSSYIMDTASGQLRFDRVGKEDVAEYYCEASNTEGKQKSTAVRMEVNDVNVGGIVAAVLISLLILALIAFAVWFAYQRGYIGKKSNKKVIYSQASETRSDKNFQQTSSFLV